MPRIETTAGQLKYAARGTGPALVCIHGAGGSHTHWGYQLRDLAPRARVIAIDLPGHGGSAGPGHTSIGGYGTALLAMLDALQIGSAFLAGHSLGGAVALQTTLDAPERVRGLALLGTGAHLSVSPAILDSIHNNRADTIALLAKLFYARDASPMLRQRSVEELSAGDPATLHGDFVACNGFDVRARLGEVACPTLVLVGEADRMTPPAQSQELADGIARAQMQIIANAGHMAMIEQPQAVSAALGAWLESAHKKATP